MTGHRSFESSSDALDYAYKIKEYYFGDTDQNKYSMSLTEEEIMDYLLDSGYSGKDRGKFFDMVISSLVDLGVNLEMQEYSVGGEIKKDRREWEMIYLNVISGVQYIKLNYSDYSVIDKMIADDKIYFPIWDIKFSKAELNSKLSYYMSKDNTVYVITHNEDTIVAIGLSTTNEKPVNDNSKPAQFQYSRDVDWIFLGDLPIEHLISENQLPYFRGRLTSWYEKNEINNFVDNLIKYEIKNSYQLGGNIRQYSNGGDLSQLMAMSEMTGMGGMGAGKKSDLELKLEYKEKERLRKEKERKAKERSKKIKKFKGSVKKGFSSVFKKIKKHWDSGGLMDMTYNDDYTGMYMATETMVRNQLVNGEISESSLREILGKTPDYPNQVVGSLLLKKCFLRPFYKI